MNILHTLTLSALVTISLSADDAKLLKDAKEVGLLPIPSDERALFKLIDNNQENKLTKEKIELGKMLYFDTRLSRDNTISCNSCHDLKNGGDDNLGVAVGIKGRENPHALGSPTVYNAVFFEKQFWDGRSPNLEDQAKGPIQAGPEMDMPKDLAVKAIKAIKGYLKYFKKAFPNEKDPITFDNIAKAIASFEKTLVTPSRFDKFMEGDLNALSKDEKAGLRLFLEVGCAACHNGIGVGSGRMEFYKNVHPHDYGKKGDFNGNEHGMVKIPTLRNIHDTAPYFHNGSADNIQTSIKIMGVTQLGVDLKKEEIESINIFLQSIDGKKPKIKEPTLPK